MRVPWWRIHRARTSFTYGAAYALAQQGQYRAADVWLTRMWADVQEYDLEFARPLGIWTRALIRLGMRRFGEAERLLQNPRRFGRRRTPMIATHLTPEASGHDCFYRRKAPMTVRLTSQDCPSTGLPIVAGRVPGHAGDGVRCSRRSLRRRSRRERSAGSVANGRSPRAGPAAPAPFQPRTNPRRRATTRQRRPARGVGSRCVRAPHFFGVRDAIAANLVGWRDRSKDLYDALKRSRPGASRRLPTRPTLAR